MFKVTQPVRGEIGPEPRVPSQAPMLPLLEGAVLATWNVHHLLGVRLIRGWKGKAEGDVRGVESGTEGCPRALETQMGHQPAGVSPRR